MTCELVLLVKRGREAGVVCPASTQRVEPADHIDIFDEWETVTNGLRKGRLSSVNDGRDDRPAKAEPVSPTEADGLPPVVARLVVEIRSDGSRTVARGALEDAISGQDVAVAVEAESPAALLGKLTRSLVSLPSMLRPSRGALPEASDDEPSSLRSLGRRLRRRLSRRR